MKYHVEFSKPAIKQLKKLDRPTAGLIIGWIKKNLEDCTNPRIHGKCLTGDKSGSWRYRVGDYRIIANIEDDRVLILIVNVGHRKNIYKN